MQKDFGNGYGLLALVLWSDDTHLDNAGKSKVQPSWPAGVSQSNCLGIDARCNSLEEYTARLPATAGHSKKRRTVTQEKIVNAYAQVGSSFDFCLIGLLKQNLLLCTAII